MEDIKMLVHDLLIGKEKNVALVHTKLKSALDIGYFGLRKTFTQEQVTALSEINKLVATWDNSDSQKAFVQYYYNQLGGPLVDIVDHYVVDAQNKDVFTKLVTFMIGAGIPGNDLDEFESWLDGDDLKVGDGYRLVTPSKNIYSLVVVKEVNPRSWRVSFFGAKNIVAQMKKIFSQ
ncbi:MAG: hypothetical protein AABX52_01160 [Nanoarchaeota archaeon]